jgi:hypothetical protein
MCRWTAQTGHNGTFIRSVGAGGVPPRWGSGGGSGWVQAGFRLGSGWGRAAWSGEDDEGVAFLDDIALGDDDL